MPKPQDDDKANGLDQLRTIRASQLAKALGYSALTLDRWVRQGKFPKPIYLTDGSPKTWLVRDVIALIEKRRRSRRVRPKPRGLLKQQER